ncbi:MAG: hypothetical protein J6A73_02525 [Lachnospiraceae bacterium]|nr:hypothetical protein [Lachnospiraceae bacterium]
MQEPTTTFIKKNLDNCKNEKEALKFIKENIEPIDAKSFPRFINDYLAKHSNLTPAIIIKRSGIKRTYGYAILNGDKKSSRDKIIALCLAAEMTENELNHALIYSGHNSLHPKNVRDALISYYFKNKKTANAIDLNNFLSENDSEQLDIYIY